MNRTLRLAFALALAAASAAAASDFRLEKRFDLASGGQFVLHSEAGGVTVRGGTGTQAVIVVTAEDGEEFNSRFNVRFDTQPSRVSFVVERKDHGWFHWFEGFHSRVHVDVELPRSASADVSSSGGSVQLSELVGPVKVGSSGGSVRIADVDGDVVSSSSGGSVHVERVKGGVRAESSGGGVELADIGGAVHLESSGGSLVASRIGGDIEANTSGGGVRIEEAGGRVEAESSGGPVKVSFSAGNARGGSLDSSGGGVTARVDPAAGLEIDASSSGGSVSSDLPVTIRGRVSRDTLRGTLNGGGSLLKLRSSGGGITLAPR